MRPGGWMFFQWYSEGEHQYVENRSCDCMWKSQKNCLCGRIHLFALRGISMYFSCQRGKISSGAIIIVILRRDGARLFWLLLGIFTFCVLSDGFVKFPFTYYKLTLFSTYWQLLDVLSFSTYGRQPPSPEHLILPEGGRTGICCPSFERKPHRRRQWKPWVPLR